MLPLAVTVGLSDVTTVKEMPRMQPSEEHLHKAVASSLSTTAKNLNTSEVKRNQETIRKEESLMESAT